MAEKNILDEKFIEFIALRVNSNLDLRISSPIYVIFVQRCDILTPDYLTTIDFHLPNGLQALNNR